MTDTKTPSAPREEAQLCTCFRTENSVSYVTNKCYECGLEPPMVNIGCLSSLPTTSKLNDSFATLAVWNAKTEAEQVEWIAVEIMGWKKNQETGYKWRFADDGTDVYWQWENKDSTFGSRKGWNPLTDWNHWRQVEEKIMEDEELWEEMMEQNHQLPNKRSFDVYSYWKATPPERGSALYLAYTSLHPTL